MRTLMLVENLPYPTFKGGDLRNWQNVDALRRLGVVGVFGLCSNDRRTTNPRDDIGMWRSSTDPDLAFPSSPARAALARRWLLDADGHPSDTYYTAAAATEFERALAQFRADVVVIERLWLHRYIPHARRANAFVVFDAHNIEAELSRQLAAAERADGMPNRRLNETLAARTAVIEARALRAVDQIWVCSESDRGRVAAAYAPDAPIHVVPNGVDVASYLDGDPPGPVGDRGPLTIVFPAMFTYAPNAAAARFLIDELMPRMDATRLAVRLMLVGSMPTEAMLAATGRDERIVVTGAVPDMRPYLRAAGVVVVPLFEGSGTRFKILEAFATRVPVVTTPVGADGLDVEHGTHVLVARTAAEFADAVARIGSDPALRARLTGRAFDLVSTRYSWDAAYRGIRHALASRQPQGVTP